MKAEIIKLASICISFVLVGCQTDATQNYTRTVSGQVIGSSEYREISPGDSQLYVPPEFGVVSQRRGRPLVDRYDEFVRFPAGWINFQQLYGAGFSHSATNAGAIQTVLDGDWYRRNGFPSLPGPLKRGRNRYGDFNYAVVDGTSVRCVIFAQYFTLRTTSWTAGPGDSELKAANCIRSTDANYANTEQVSLSAWDKIRVGTGVNQPSTPAVTAPTSTPEKQPTRDTASRLNELQKLLDQKLITPEEYAARRREILQSL